MPADVAITSTTLPQFLWQGDVQQLLDLFAEHLEGEFTGDVLAGQTNGTAPTSDIGIWRNGNVLYSWNTAEARYLPNPVAIGRVYTGGVLTITSILSSATADRTLYTPDKNGTLATTGDIFDGRTTTTLGGTAPTVDWNIDGSEYYLTLSGNTVINHANGADGQEKHVWIEQPASGSYTVAWTPTIIWPDGLTITQSTAGAGVRAIDYYTFTKVGAYVFGNTIKDYQISTSGGSGGDVTPPTVSTRTRISTGTITITFNELLQGGTLTAGDFLVVNAGVSKTVTSVIASGNTVTLTVTANTNTVSTVMTVQYTGSTIKDVAGNAAAVFGPSSVTFVSSGGGSGGGGGQNEP